MANHPKLGELLVRSNLITEAQLSSALSEQKRWGGKLGDILVRMSFISEENLVKVLSRQMNVPAVNLDTIQGILPEVKAKVPADIARVMNAVPLQLREENRTLLVAMAEPQNLRHLDTLRSVSKCKVVPQLAGKAQIARAFTRFYEGGVELTDPEESFKVVDAQGHTVVRVSPSAPAPAPAPPSSAPRPGSRPPQSPSPSAPPAPAAAGNVDLTALMRTVEDSLRKEEVALRAMIELLIEKGLFTREEYLAKMKR